MLAASGSGVGWAGVGAASLLISLRSSFGILDRDEQVLLARREGTGYADGQWNLPSGKLEADEYMVAAIIREAREEIDVELDRDDLEMVTTVHYRNPEGQARVGFFFRARRWRGEPRNAEPHKCSQIAWFPKDSLPENTVPYTHAGCGTLPSRRAVGPAGLAASGRAGSSRTLNPRRSPLMKSLRTVHTTEGIRRMVIACQADGQPATGNSAHQDLLE